MKKKIKSHSGVLQAPPSVKVLFQINITKLLRLLSAMLYTSIISRIKKKDGHDEKTYHLNPDVFKKLSECS